MKDIIIDWFASWPSQLFLFLATVAFFTYYVWVEWRPTAMERFFRRILKLVANALKSNKAFMHWLYGEKAKAEEASMPVKIRKHWRTDRW